MTPRDPEDPGMARERTRLAWTRTAIAFAALGAVVLKKEVLDGLVILGAAPLVWAIGHFAGQKSRPEQLARRLLLVTLTVIVTAVVAVIVAFLGHSPSSLDQLLPLHG